MITTSHGGTFEDGTEWEVVISCEQVSEEAWEGWLFKAPNVPGLERFEVARDNGEVAPNWDSLPDELSPYQAAAVSALLLEAVG